jgi:hypothetical protein
MYGAENVISLTIGEHQELGREMKATTKRLRALCDLVVSVYGPANRAAFSFLKAMEAIEHLEQDLATQAMRDLPGYPSNDLYLADRPANAAAFLVGMAAAASVEGSGDDEVVAPVDSAEDAPA